MGFPRQEYGVDCHALRQGIFLTQGFNPSLLSPALTSRFFTTNATLLLLLSHFSHVQLCATPETAAHQAPPSLGFSRQEHWSGLPFPSLGDLDPGIKPESLALAGGFFTTSTTFKIKINHIKKLSFVYYYQFHYLVI